MRAHLFPRRVNSGDTAVNASRANPRAQPPLPQHPSPEQGTGDSPGGRILGSRQTRDAPARATERCSSAGGPGEVVSPRWWWPSCPVAGAREVNPVIQIIPSFKKKSPGAEGMRRWQKGREGEGVRARHKPLWGCLCPQIPSLGWLDLPQQLRGGHKTPKLRREGFSSHPGAAQGTKNTP